MSSIGILPHPLDHRCWFVRSFDRCSSVRGKWVLFGVLERGGWGGEMVIYREGKPERRECEAVPRVSFFLSPFPRLLPNSEMLVVAAGAVV